MKYFLWFREFEFHPRENSETVFQSIPLVSGEEAFKPRGQIIRESTKFWFSFNTIEIKSNLLNSAWRSSSQFWFSKVCCHWCRESPLNAAPTFLFSLFVSSVLRSSAASPIILVASSLCFGLCPFSYVFALVWKVCHFWKCNSWTSPFLSFDFLVYVVLARRTSP